MKRLSTHSNRKKQLSAAATALLLAFMYIGSSYTASHVTIDPGAVPLGSQYDSVAQMKADTDLTAGETVTTAAYYEGGSAQGGATYDIAEKSKNLLGYADNGYSIPLDNGLYALLDEDTWNLYMWGAHGDGSSNDSDAIDQAFTTASLAGQIMWVTPGTYYMQREVSLRSGLTVYGQGDCEFLAAEGYPVGGTVFSCWNQNGIKLHGITISGNSQVNSRSKGYSDQDGIHLLDTWSTDNVELKNVTFQDNIYCAYRIMGCQYVDIEDCTFNQVDCGVLTLSSKTTSHVNILNNVFTGHKYSEAIVMGCGSTISDVTISGNQISDKTEGHGIQLVAWGKESISDITITNNQITNCAVDIEINDAKNVTVSDNTCTTTTGGYGMLVEDSSKVKVTDNTVTDSYLSCLSIKDSKYCTASDNVLDGWTAVTYNPGVYLEGTLTGTKVIENTIQASSQTNFDVAIDVNGTGATIKNNTIPDDFVVNYRNSTARKSTSRTK